MSSDAASREALDGPDDEPEVRDLRRNMGALEYTVRELLYQKRALEAEVRDLTAKAEQGEGFRERVIDHITGYEWLAEGRGPYRYDDQRYDDDVQRLVRGLLELLPAGRSLGWHALLKERDDLTQQLDTMRRERDEARQKAALADEVAGGVMYMMNHLPAAQAPWVRSDWEDWLARYRALTDTGSEGS